MRSLLVFSVLACPMPFANAQDAEGCKDHPLFNRMPDFVIEECSENFNTMVFQTGAGEERTTLEGTLTTIRYVRNAESPAKPPSPLQIVRNYENAVKAKGGRTVYTGADDEGGGPLGGLFQFSGKGRIETTSQGTIDQLAQMLKDNASLNVSIEGHTDNTGTAEGNKTLSQKRAEAVVAALVGKVLRRPG